MPRTLGCRGDKHAETKARAEIQHIDKKGKTNGHTHPSLIIHAQKRRALDP